MAPKSIQLIVRNILAGLTLLFCFGLAKFQVVAQNSGVLSKQLPVIRIFDPDKNESIVSAILLDPNSSDIGGMFGRSPDYPPPSLRLHSAEYTYPGKVRSRPQAVAFVFLPLDRYKSAPAFSITADGTVLSEGQATFNEWCCVKVNNGPTETQQRIMVAVSVDVFERLTQAKKIELKLTSKSGKYSFKLKDYQKRCLAALANTIK